MISMRRKWIPRKIVDELLDNPLVAGVSLTPKPKIVGGRETDRKSIRVYVFKKLPREHVPRAFLIPEEINGLETDVVEIGNVEAHAVQVDPPINGVYRPLVAGVSIGNIKITAGTLGGFYERDGETFLISNAHVFTPDATAKEASDKRITQPGPYDIRQENLGDPEKYVVAELVEYTHIEPMAPSDCGLSKTIVYTLNFLSWLFGRKTRFYTYVKHRNTADAAIALPTVEYREEFVYPSVDMGDVVALGLLFAGSDYATVFSKARHIDDRFGGEFTGVYETSYEVWDGMRVCKIGRTTGYTCGKVIDDSVDIKVWYGNALALFHDVAMTEPMSKGGDSGSLVFTSIDEITGA